MERKINIRDMVNTQVKLSKRSRSQNEGLGICERTRLMYQMFFSKWTQGSLYDGEAHRLRRLLIVLCPSTFLHAGKISWILLNALVQAVNE